MPRVLPCSHRTRPADLPMRLLAAEVTREKLLLRIPGKLPYQLNVETERLGRAKRWLRSHQQGNYCRARGPQGPLVLGKNGASIKEIGRWP